MSKEFRFVHELTEKYAEHYDVQASTVAGYWRHMGIYDYIVMEQERLAGMSFSAIFERIDELLVSGGWSYTAE